MSQAPAIDWESSPDNTSGKLAPAPEPEAPPVVVAKVESFADAVEAKAQEQVAMLKITTDAKRMNDAVAVRVAELVAEYGLPPPMSEEQTIAELAAGHLDRFKIKRLDVLASEKAEAEFFALYPDAQARVDAFQAAQAAAKKPAHGGRWKKKP